MLSMFTRFSARAHAKHSACAVAASPSLLADNLTCVGPCINLQMIIQCIVIKSTFDNFFSRRLERNNIGFS